MFRLSLNANIKSISMYSVRHRLWRVHNPSFTPTHERTQIIGNRQAFKKHGLTKSALARGQTIFYFEKKRRTRVNCLVFELLFIKELNLLFYSTVSEHRNIVTKMVLSFSIIWLCFLISLLRTSLLMWFNTDLIPIAARHTSLCILN